MFRKFKELAAKPKKKGTRKDLLKVLGVQGAFLIIVLIVVTFFQKSAESLAPILILALGITLSLWLEAWDYRLGSDKQPDQKENIT